MRVDAACQGQKRNHGDLDLTGQLVCAHRLHQVIDRAAPSTSGAIKRCAVKLIISRNRSASELFPSRLRRIIMSSVIGGFQVAVWQPNPEPETAMAARCA